MSDDDKSNPIEDLFKLVKPNENEVSKELFKTQDSDLDLKTDVVYPEDVYISTLKFNDDFLESKGLCRIYEKYLKDLLRVRFSLDRKSRVEFVEVNTRKMSNFQMPGEFKTIKDSRT